MGGQVCPSVLKQGTCATPDCPFNHQPFACELCKVFAGTAVSLQSHLDGKRHQSAVAGNARWECWMCDIRNPPRWQTFDHHQTTPLHRIRLAAMARSGGVYPEELSEDDMTTCPSCNMDVNRELFSLHLLSPFHVRKEKFTTYTRSIKNAEKGQHGVAILEQTFDFGVVETSSLRSRPVVTRKFQIESQDRVVKLVEARTSSSVGGLARFRQVKYGYLLRASHGTDQLLPLSFRTVTTLPLSIWRGRTSDLELAFDPQGT